MMPPLWSFDGSDQTASVQVKVLLNMMPRRTFERTLDGRSVSTLEARLFLRPYRNKTLHLRELTTNLFVYIYCAHYVCVRCDEPMRRRLFTHVFFWQHYHLSADFDIDKCIVIIFVLRLWSERQARRTRIAISNECIWLKRREAPENIQT